MRSILKKVFSFELYKNFLVTLGGSAAAQILPILITPILAFQYGPEQLGIFGIFVSYTYLLSKTLSLSYFQTIMLPKGETKAMALLILSLFVSFVTSILLIMVFYLLEYFWEITIVGITNKESALGLACFFFMGNVSLEIWLSRKKLYKFLSVSRVLRAAFVAVFSILFYYVYFDADGLVYAFVVGNAITFLYIAAKIFYANEKIVNLQSSGLVWSQARRYFSYSLYNTPSYLVNSLTNYLPVFFIARNFDPAAMGFYYLAERVMRSPLGLISDSVANVLFQQLSVTSKESMMHEVNKYGKILSGIGLVVLVAFFLFGKFLLGSFFTEEWIFAFPLMRVVIVYGIIQMVLTIYCLPLRVAEMNKEYLYWEILRFVLVLLPLVALSQSSIESYLVGYGAGLSLSYLILVIYNRYIFARAYVK